MLIKEIINTKNINKIINKNNITNPIKNLFGRDEFWFDIYKSRCINALNCENPHEVVMLLDKNTYKCLGEFSGGIENCAINLQNTSSPLLLLHGHPPVNGTSLPVSVQDFILMNDNNIDKIVAYNCKGEQSFLQKTPQFNRLSDDKIAQLKTSYMRHIIDCAPKEAAENVKKLMCYCAKQKNSKLVKQEIAENLYSLQFASEDVVDSFWKKFAKDLNLKYFSNFSATQNV